MNDEIIYFCISYFETKYNAKFSYNNVTIDNDDLYYWYATYPYIIHHPDKSKSINILKTIKKLKSFKEIWSRKCQTDLDNVLDLHDKSSYDVFVDTPILSKHKLDVSNFLDNYKILNIASPMATGKSNIIQEVLTQANDRNLSVLMITSRVSLSNDIYEKYKHLNMKHYQSNLYSLRDHLVVQFDTLLNFDMEYFDIVMIDEITSFMLYASDTYENKQDRYNKNLRQFNKLKEKKFVLSDAFMMDFPFVGKTLGIYNSYREDLNVIEYEDLNWFKAKILKASAITSKLISISSNEVRFLKAIKTKLEAKGKKCLLLIGDTKNKESIYKIFSEKETDVDVILYSPTLTVGVSIFLDIDDHFHYDNGGTIDVISSLQMLRRARNAKNIHYYIQGKSSYLETNTENIQNWLSGDYHIVNREGQKLGINDIGKILTNFIYIKNILKNTHKYAFRKFLLLQFRSVKTSSYRIL